MQCKECGTQIPSELLQKDSFRCPNCGKMYRKTAKKATAGAQAEGAKKNPESQKSAGSNKKKNGKIFFLVAICIVIVILVEVVVLFAPKKETPKEPEIVSFGDIALQVPYGTEVETDESNYISISLDDPDSSEQILVTALNAEGVSNDELLNYEEVRESFSSMSTEGAMAMQFEGAVSIGEQEAFLQQYTTDYMYCKMYQFIYNDRLYNLVEMVVDMSGNAMSNANYVEECDRILSNLDSIIETISFNPADSSEAA